MTMLGKMAIAAAAAGFCASGWAASGLAAHESEPLQEGTEYMVAVNHPHNLHVIDLDDERVLKTCDLPGGFGPGMVQMSPDRRTAYVLSNRYGSIFGVDLDSCELNFRAEMSLRSDERAKSIFSMALSADGRQVYAVQNPTTIELDHYRVEKPRFAVYDTHAGLEAKPVRTFEAPRQSYIMQTAQDGTVYLFGPDLYKVDVESGDITVAMPIRSWRRDDYAPLDVLSFWPVETPQKDFTVLYTTAKYQDESKSEENADFFWGFFNVNLESGETEAREFAPLTEVFFTGLRSPKDPNVIYTLLSSLVKYDIDKMEAIKTVDDLDHTYYTLLTNHDGSKLYLTGTMNDVAIYDADSLEKLGNIQLPGGDMSLSTGQVFVR